MHTSSFTSTNILQLLYVETLVWVWGRVSFVYLGTILFVWQAQNQGGHSAEHVWENN